MRQPEKRRCNEVTGILEADLPASDRLLCAATVGKPGDLHHEGGHLKGSTTHAGFRTVGKVGGESVGTF